MTAPRSPLLLGLSLSIVALTACSRDESALPARRAPTATPAPPPPPKATTTGTAAPRAATSAPPAITPQARKAYAAHLQTGRALAAEKRWGEATAELEKALANVPHDPRALLDLGWSAHQAGDARKARRASHEAWRRAPDADTKAKALYNLGRIDEADGKRDDAIKAYGDSLRLRPSSVVQRRLDELKKPPPAPSARPSASAVTPAATPLPCAAATPLDELTTCLGKAARLLDEDDGGDVGPAAIVPLDGAPEDLMKRVAIVRAPATRLEERFLLAASSLRGWTTVAELVQTYNPGAFGVTEDASFPRIEVRELKARKVLWLEVLRRRHDSDLGVDEEETEEARDVVLCLLADERRRETVCPLKLPLSISYKRARMGDAELDDDTKRLSTPGLPISREATFAVAIADDGLVTVKLARGAADDRTRALLGPHRLF